MRPDNRIDDSSLFSAGTGPIATHMSKKKINVNVWLSVEMYGSALVCPAAEVQSFAQLIRMEVPFRYTELLIRK